MPVGVDMAIVDLQRVFEFGYRLVVFAFLLVVKSSFDQSGDLLLITHLNHTFRVC